MLISVVILTCNQKCVTIRCLNSICELIDDPDCEVIVVDNGSDDGTSETITELFPKIRIIKLATNKGVAAGRNVGLRACSGEYLMILDNDTITDRNTVIGLLHFLQQHPDIGIVAPRLVSPNGTTQKSFKSFPGLTEKMKNIFLGKDRTSLTDDVPIHEIEPYYVIGAAQMFSRDIYIKAGPLDERIFFGPEDADFCISTRSIGKRVVYNPHFTIVHDWQRSTTQRPFSIGAIRHIRALLYFYIKHRRFF